MGAERVTRYERWWNGLPDTARSLVQRIRAPRGHFYSPYPRRSEVRRRAESLFTLPSALAGIDLREDQQWELLEQLAAFGADLPWGEEARPGLRYRYANRPYPWGDAIGLAMMLRHLRPRRMVEIGSGWSTVAALDVRDRFLGDELDLVTVDPYPRRLRALLGGERPDRFEVIESAVQDLDPVELVSGLRAGDILFVDSTHVVKTGSDVNHIVFELFSRLAPGVHVHVHDIFPGFEYPAAWVFQGRAWSEAYLLRAFLMFNAEFDVTLWLALLAARSPERVGAALPAVMRNPGGSIWMARRCPQQSSSAAPPTRGAQP